ncbi:MAG: superinfection immunity protein [Hyphomonadaceae bacterium]|nr:superinfection immunity protein [Hyphomonadaceae bacterium]
MNSKSVSKLSIAYLAATVLVALGLSFGEPSLAQEAAINCAQPASIEEQETCARIAGAETSPTLVVPEGGIENAAVPEPSLNEPSAAASEEQVSIKDPANVQPAAIEAPSPLSEQQVVQTSVGRGTSTGDNVTLGILAIVFLSIYLIPTFIAFSRKHPAKRVILLCNIFLGATGVGWVILFIVALWPKPSQSVDPSWRSN